MSINIHISASKRNNTVLFDCWQTPTDVSQQIIDSENPIESYIDWVTVQNCSQENKDYHLNNLKQWISLHKTDNFRIEVAAW